MRSFMNGLLDTKNIASFTDAKDTIVSIANAILGAVGVGVAFLAVYLAFKFFTASDEQKRKDAKGQMIYAIIGVIAIVVIIVLWNSVLSGLLASANGVSKT
jgi:heme/copper-type cytochrome/quinol oxidase subunit 2